MSMKSLDLLPALRELPAGEPGPRRSFRETISDLTNSDRSFYGAEKAETASAGLWAVYSNVNVDDELLETMTKAHERSFNNYDGTLTDHWQEMLERGPDSTRGFMSALKGKVAELNTAESLEQRGYTNVRIPPDPTQPVWDISATAPDGQDVLIQVKVGAEGYAGDVQGLMTEHTDIHYAVGAEIYDKIAETSPELVDQMTEIGSNYELVEGTRDGLNTLSDGMGIDVPDEVGELLPYVGAILAGARLVYTVLQTEKEFKAADRTTRNKIQVVQTLTVMSRMGVSATLATVGGMGGAAAGTAVPGVGNIVGGVVGALGGAGMGTYLNRHLQPHMLDLALDITGLSRDDLFYYKNKARIDRTALSLRETACELAAGYQDQG